MTIDLLKFCKGIHGNCKRGLNILSKKLECRDFCKNFLSSLKNKNDTEFRKLIKDVERVGPSIINILWKSRRLLSYRIINENNDVVTDIECEDDIENDNDDVDETDEEKTDEEDVDGFGSMNDDETDEEEEICVANDTPTEEDNNYKTPSMKFELKLLKTNEPIKILRAYVEFLKEYYMDLGDFSLKGKSIKTDVLFKILQCSIPNDYNKIDEISICNVKNIIEKKVKTSRNPFLVPLYKKFKLNYIDAPIQTTKCFQIIEEVTKVFRSLHWKWEVSLSKDRLDRLDLVLEDAKIAFECDENGHVHYDNEHEIKRDQRVEAHGYKIIHFNPDKQQMTEFIFYILPQIKLRGLLQTMCPDIMDSYGDKTKRRIDIDTLVKFQLADLSGNIPNNSSYKAQKDFIEECGMIVQDEIFGSKERFIYTAQKIIKYLDIESEDDLQNELEQMEEELPEDTEWIRKKDGLYLTTRAFHALLLRGNSKKSMRARNYYYSLSELLKKVLQKYNKLQDQYRSMAQVYIQKLDEVEKLKRQLHKLEHRNHTLEKENKDYVEHLEHWKRETQVKKLKISQVLTEGLGYVCIYDLNASPLKFSVVKNKISSFKHLFNSKNLKRILKNNNMYDSKKNQVIHCTLRT